MNKQFNAICDYTQQELEQHFEVEIRELTEEYSHNPTWILAEIKG